MLQRTRGEHVPSVYEEFLRRWPDSEALARAKVETIRKVVSPLGLRKRADTIKQMAGMLAGGEVPSDPKDLDELPGVGPYVAHAVPVFADGRDLPLVDWVIARVLRRVFGLPGVKRPTSDRDLWDLAGRLASRGKAARLWAGTLDLAAAICRPSPRCSECPAVSFCSYARNREIVSPST